MATIISVGSGKGGVGKSIVAANLGLLLARQGKRVVMVDLDVGGADLHVLFGLLHPPRTLTDFIKRRVETLAEVAQPIRAQAGLQLIPGTGESLSTANMPYGQKKRLIRHLKEVSADIIIVDVGAGTSYHTLDFFLMADYYLAVATAEPTSVLDLYRFIKLAGIRRVLSEFVATDPMYASLAERDFTSVSQILEEAGKTDEAGRALAERALKTFRPHLVLNRMSPRWRINTSQLKQLLREYLGGELVVLGEIPDDGAIDRSVRTFLPVVDAAPDSPAAEAFRGLVRRLDEVTQGGSEQA